MYQQITVVGRLGRDPEMRYTPAGAAVTTFSIATDRQYAGADGQQVKETTWFRVQVWNKMAEACNNYLTKGKLVMVVGRLVVDAKTGGPRLWKDRDELVRASFEITASTVRFLSPKDDATAVDASAEVGDEAPPAEDIPF